MYAYASVAPSRSRFTQIYLPDLPFEEQFTASKILDFDKSSPSALIRAILSRFFTIFGPLPPMEVSAWSDAPAGSGLGSSSTLVVAICNAIASALSIPLSEYDLAHLAYEIERLDMQMAGGQQDQYAAAFGGLNFMEFHTDGSVLVNPLRIKSSVLNELESSLLLYFTGVSRLSANIIQDQILSINSGAGDSIEAMHRVKEEAITMKRSLLRGEIPAFYNALNEGWNQKKKTSKSISNPLIESIVETAKESGAQAAKLSGAGGGGFIMFFVTPEVRQNVAKRLLQYGGQIYPVNFTQFGSETWSPKTPK
jgi:D-glycero-alpha-D-manno-heptose-7-phosphate kinase